MVIYSLLYQNLLILFLQPIKEKNFFNNIKLLYIMKLYIIIIIFIFYVYKKIYYLIINYYL